MGAGGERGMQTMRPIDADKIVFDYSGLAHIPSNDFIGIAKYFADQIEAMPTIVPPPNGPLTMEELREMDGEPVWVQYGQYDGEWLIVAWNIYDAISYARKAPFKLSVYSYGDTWIAYRRKPEEEHNCNG